MVSEGEKASGEWKGRFSEVSKGGFDEDWREWRARMRRSRV